jgi:hypothetical protein
MAVADSRYGSGGGKKRRKKRGRRKKKMEARSQEERSGEGENPHAPTRSQQNPHFSQKTREMGHPVLGEPSSELQRDPEKKRLPPKMMGELGELDFLRKAMGMGMIVSKPWGDSYRYDFVCDTGGKMWRVQVRATEYRMGARGYAVHASVVVGHKIVGLTEKDIDVIVAYISTRDIWYVVPVRAFVPRKNLWFYPDGSKKGAMFEKYRDAWWVMMGKTEGRSR